MKRTIFCLSILLLFLGFIVFNLLGVSSADDADDLVIEISNANCIATYGSNVKSYLPDMNYCVCVNGYSWDNDGSSCIKGSTKENIKRMSRASYVWTYDPDLMERDLSCHEQYGVYSQAGDPGYCVCQRLYVWNNDGTKCIPLTKSMGDNICKNSYGNNSVVADDDYERCVCKNGYERNSAGTACIKKSSCDNYGPNAYLGTDNYCYCKNGYERNFNKNRCVASRNSDLYNGTDFRSAKDGGEYINMLLDYEDYIYCRKNGMKDINNCKSYNGAKCVCKECEDGYVLNSNGTSCLLTDKQCKLWYGENSYAGTDNLCYCKGGYQRNSSMTSCIKSQTTNTINTTNTQKKYFSDYKLDAYNFAFKNGITTMTTVDEADMYGNLDRIAMAKMIGNYAINILGLIPDTSKTCYFPDVSNKLNEQYDDGVKKACQLGLMGQGITKFRPRDMVTRAEFATVLSRLINRNSSNLYYMNNANPYYSEHIAFLKNNGIIDYVVRLSEYDNEIRGYVMLMLMRANNFEKVEESNCTADEIVECTLSNDMDKCLSICNGDR